MKIKLCECGHSGHLHVIFGQPSGCVVGLMSLDPCPCKEFKPTKKSLDYCQTCREIIKPILDMAGGKFCPFCGNRQ